MDPADRTPADLVPGMTVRAEVVGHQPWGVFVRITGFEGIVASVDALSIDSRSGFAMAAPGERPPVGAEVTAVVVEVRRGLRSGSVRLSTRAATLAGYWRSCDFCCTDALLSPGGDGVVLDVRSAEDPGQGHAVVAHRACLAAALHPESLERHRVDRLGRSR